MRPRTDRRRRWKRRWAERRGATENQRRCVRVPWRIIFSKKFVIFPDAVLLVEAENSALYACPAKIEAGGRLPTGTRCRISCLQLSTTACRHEKSARRRTRSGGPRPARTGAERRHRTFEPCQGPKKRTIPIWYRSFFKRETGIEPATPSLARRCSTAEPLAHVLRTSYNIL